MGSDVFGIFPNVSTITKTIPNANEIRQVHNPNHTAYGTLNAIANRGLTISFRTEPSRATQRLRPKWNIFQMRFTSYR